MAPVSQQGSRTSLITAVVIFSILFVVALVFALYYSAEARKAQQDLATFKARYTDAISDAFLSSPEFQELKNLRADANAGFDAKSKIMDVVLKQRDRLAQVITGNPRGGTTAAVAAESAARQQLTTAGNQAKAADVALPALTGNLNGAIDILTKALVSSNQQIGTLRQQLKDARDALAALDKRTKDELAKKDQELAQKRQATDQEVAQAATDRTQKQAQINQIQAQFDTDRKNLIEQRQQKEAELAKLAKDMEQTQRRLDAVLAKLNRQNVGDPMLRTADGSITRLPGDGICYISRGLGDQIVPGLTFEVYDKRTGIPTPGDPTSEESLPIGKASIEVIHVGPASSECRITRIRPGATLQEGDVIANLVYDANSKYSFVAYGKFDLDQNSVATAQDTDVVKRLIGQWGGLVTDKIGVDTDFVILGKEPAVPNFTLEELQDPINKKKQDDAQAELDAYNDLLQQARSLHIPILNQNRFLYFVGYYELAKR